MRAFLYFLLGFSIVFASGISYGAWPGECQKIFYCSFSNTMPSGSWAYNSFNYDQNTGIVSHVGMGTYNGPFATMGVKVYYFDSLSGWLRKSILSNSNHTISTPIPDDWILVTDLSDSAIVPTLGSCSKDCPDNDSDGLCDACDQDPNDSTIGGDLYLKGYYEYNGEVVASLVSYSPNSTSYDHTRINKEYSGNITEVPGYVLGLGMPTHIRPDEFINGGGKFVGLIQPEKVTSISCAPVTDISSCNSDLCNFSPANASAEKKYPEAGDNIKPSTEQKQEDANYLYPEKTCDQYQSLCTSSCGGSPMVQGFACSEGSSGYKHVNCDCVHGGYYEIAPDWNSLGPQDESSTGEDDTGSGTSGTGTTTTGGGSSTSAGGDQDLDGDGSVDGSPYEYAEGKVDYSPVGAAFGRLGGRFPFSLRNTISELYSSFRHSGAAPSYSYTIYGRSLTINLSAWNDIAQMVRSLFSLGIVLSTILMLIYLYVGIDLRGKA